MRYVIDKDICEKNGLEVSELLSILLLNIGKPYDECIKSLVEKDVLGEEKTLLGTEYKISLSWIDRISTILADSELKPIKGIEERIDNLSLNLIELFPQGQKIGTNKYWRGNKRDVRLKLKKFFVKYGDKYTDDQIIKATKSYVDSFNGNYTYMRTLQYFIYKDERRVGGEEVSDLATYIENLGQANAPKSDIGELV